MIRHQRRGKGEGMCGNQQVHGADRLSGVFQLVPDAAAIAERSSAVGRKVWPSSSSRECS
jgi:hypothetical protein